ncbi:MAG: hypothetical protein JF606_18595 [Burkholderiales bacterium]|nr:hypothetical protein [Burkholderiales bacterium]
MRTSTRRIQRGISLVEALIAFLVLSLGTLGMSKLQSHLRLHSDIARQRSEAVRIAQEDMESLRSFTSTTTEMNEHSYGDISSASATIAPSRERSGNTSFHVERSISEGNGFRTASVSVNWPDRLGHRQHVILESVIAGTPPRLSGALTLVQHLKPMRPVWDRSPAIPAQARNLGNGSSAFKPSETGTLAFVFDNASGLVTSRCDQVAATVRNSELDTAKLVDCTPMRGMLLSGIVRVSLDVPPDAAHPADAALLFDMNLTITGAGKPEMPICVTDAATRVVAYHCVIAPVAGRWSGRSSLVPRGWTLGTAATDRKVCRYSADQDGSGAIDSNAEHPNEYKDVDRSLMQQNFLIVRGNQPCPVASKGEAVFADLTTVQHQP